MMILTKAERMYFNRLKSFSIIMPKAKTSYVKLIKELNESNTSMQKLIKELNEKLPININ